MGFEKWFYRNGFGSPGHTARTIVKWYHNYLAVNMIYESADIFEEACMYIYNQRMKVQEKLRNKGCLMWQFQDRINYVIAEKDLALFVVAIESLETKQFRTSISNNNIDLVLEVIREEIEKLDTSLIRLTYSEYRTLSFNLLNSVLEFADQN